MNDTEKGHEIGKVLSQIQSTRWHHHNNHRKKGGNWWEFCSPRPCSSIERRGFFVGKQSHLLGTISEVWGFLKPNYPKSRWWWWQRFVRNMVNHNLVKNWDWHKCPVQANTFRTPKKPGQMTSVKDTGSRGYCVKLGSRQPHKTYVRIPLSSVRRRCWWGRRIPFLFPARPSSESQCVSPKTKLTGARSATTATEPSCPTAVKRSTCNADASGENVQNYMQEERKAELERSWVSLWKDMPQSNLWKRPFVRHCS